MTHHKFSATLIHQSMSLPRLITPNLSPWIPVLTCVMHALTMALATMLVIRWYDYGFQHGNDLQNWGGVCYLSSY